MPLIYVSVSTDYNNPVNQYYPHVLYNPVRQNFDRIKTIQRTNMTVIFADSGGLQLFRYRDSSVKSCIVVPGGKISNTKSRIVIDPIDLCRLYGKIGVNYGFTLDEPLCDNPGPQQYFKELENSYRSAKLMFDFRNKLCPNTKLLIPLHSITKNQLHHYFERMSDLSPDGFAFTARSRFDLKGLIKIALTLCYLHSNGVTMVHLLGSSRQEIIIIGAAAVGLKMFSQISFDSRTWNTGNFNTKTIVIDSETLRQRMIAPGEIINLFVPKKSLYNSSLSGTEHLKKIILLHNAFAISAYTKKVADIATDITRLKKHLLTMRLSKHRAERILTAIDVLETYSVKGYGYLEKWLSWIWF
jgi:queuine/archaeosine tRNA-ribosyltransferase